MAVETARPDDELFAALLELCAGERALLAANEAEAAASRARAGAALRQLTDLGTPAAVLERGPAAVGFELDLDAVVISHAGGGTMQPIASWCRPGQRGASPPEEVHDHRVALAYPLVEAEAVAAGTARLVDLAAEPRRSPRFLREPLGWVQYVVAPIVLDGAVSGLIHGGSRPDGRSLGPADLAALSRVADGLGPVLEIALLRHTLHVHQRELATASAWLEDRRRSADSGVHEEQPGRHAAEMLGLLTPRERDVLALMARGLTNPRIAEQLAISEGTAKYHVKNVLRKLGATNRADAVSRYLKSEGAVAS